MFFALSKAAWFFAEPLNLLGFVLVLCVAGLATRFAGAARRLLAFTAIVYALAAFGPLGDILIGPLENRFPRPAPDMAAPYGIIVLGGAMDENVSDARGALVLDEFGSRMTEAVALSRRFPNARMAFTGGAASFLAQRTTEAEIARRFFEAMGVQPGRFVYEDKSRNTYENATFVRDLLKPEPGQSWLLVTSGFHIPRAMGAFRRAGFNVVAWPADYLTSGTSRDFWRFHERADIGLRLVTVGVREWIGLAAYRASGMTGDLFPAP